MSSAHARPRTTLALASALGFGVIVILLVAYLAAFHGWRTAVPASDPAATEHAQTAHAAIANRLLIALGALAIAEIAGVIWLIRRGGTRQGHAARANEPVTHTN